MITNIIMKFSLLTELYTGEMTIPNQTNVYHFIKDNMFNIFMLIVDIHRTRIRSGSANNEVIALTHDVLNTNIRAWVNPCLSIISGADIPVQPYSP